MMRIPAVFARFPREWLLALLAVLVGGAVLVTLLVARPGIITVDDLRESFNHRVEIASGLQLLSPLVVTVYERSTDADNLATTEVGRADDEQLVDLSYGERLVVVKPQNWIVYTNNGINFYLITNNVSNRTAQCDLDRQLIAIDFRLLTADESADTRDQSGRFKVACINYTLDTLIRLFGVHANRTYVDLSAYFDKTRNANAPPVVVDEVINYLLLHGLV